MKKNNSGFTLVEVMVASLISMIILGGVVVLFLTSLDTWTVGGADIRLERCAGLMIEKVIRGVGGKYGLREADQTSIVVDLGGTRITFSVDKNDPPTYSISDDTTVSIYYDGVNRRVIYDPDTSVSGDQFEISRGAVVENVTFTHNGDMVDITVLLSDTVTTASKTVEMEFQTSVYLRKS